MGRMVRSYNGGVNHHPKITPLYQLKFPPPCALFE